MDWAGSFVVTLAGGEVISGPKPLVVPLPANVPQRLARVSELMATSHMGGSVVRSVKAPVPASKVDITRGNECLRVNASEHDDR